jgi:hypothetical protein
MFCITFSHFEFVIFPISIIKIHIIHFNLFGSLILNLIMGVEAHYNGQKMLSQILFFKHVQLSTFTKPILKEVFINDTQNKVVQLLDNAIVKRNYIFLLIF